MQSNWNRFFYFSNELRNDSMTNTADPLFFSWAMKFHNWNFTHHTLSLYLIRYIIFICIYLFIFKKKPLKANQGKRCVGSFLFQNFSRHPPTQNTFSFSPVPMIWISKTNKSHLFGFVWASPCCERKVGGAGQRIWNYWVKILMERSQSPSRCSQRLMLMLSKLGSILAMLFFSFLFLFKLFFIYLEGNWLNLKYVLFCLCVLRALPPTRRRCSETKTSYWANKVLRMNLRGLRAKRKLRVLCLVSSYHLLQVCTKFFFFFAAYCCLCANSS